jgi:hypothetical protein
MTAAERLDAIEARAAAATDGPWRADDEHGLIDDAMPAWCVSRTDTDDAYLGDVAYMPQTSPQERENADFIANARDDVPWLVDQVRKRDAAFRAVLAILDDTNNHVEGNDDWEGDPLVDVWSIRDAIAAVLDGAS